MIYLICFAVSAVCAELASREKDRKKVIAYSVFAIMVTALLAGLRDYSVGIDTGSYLTKKEYWGGASGYPTWGEYWSFYVRHGSGEYLFALLLGTIEQLTGNYSLFLLTVHTVIISGIYIGAYRMRRYASPGLVLMMFYLLYYNQSLNIMRQYMAMAMVFAALPDVLQRKRWRYCVVVLLASLIHKTALISYAALLIDWYLKCDLDRIVKLPGKAAAALRRLTGKDAPDPKGRRRNRSGGFRLPDPFRPTIPQRQVILFVGLLLLVVLFNPLCRLFIAIGIIPEKYLFYVKLTKMDYNLLSTLFMLAEMPLLLLLREYMRRRIRCFDFYFSNTLSYLALLQLNFVLRYGRRIAMYFSLANLITVAMMPRIYRDRRKRTVVTVLILLAVLCYWLYVYALRNASKTLPYQFIF